MAYPIADESTLSAILRGRMFGQDILFTTHWLYEGPVIADGRDALEDFRAVLDQAGGIADRYSKCIPDTVTNLTWHLQWIALDRYRPFFQASEWNTGSNGDSQITNITAALHLTGDRSGKRFQGVKHIVLPSDKVDDGTVVIGTVAKLTALGQAMVATEPMGAGTVTSVIYGPPRLGFTKCGKTYPPLPRIHTEITGHTVGVTSRVQRRRTVGLGV